MTGQASALARQPTRQVTQSAIMSSGLAPVLLIGAWVIADLLQPASYSPIRQTVSVLAGYAGTDRWIMTAALFLVGGCHLVTAAGLTAVRIRARILLAIAGLASIGIAASPEPAHGSSPSHLAWTVVGITAITLWPAFAVRLRSPGPAVLSVRVTTAATAVLITLAGWLLFETQGGDVLGLAERLTTAAQTSWPFVVALALHRTTTPTATTTRAGAAGTVPGPPPPRSGGASLVRDAECKVALLVDLSVERLVLEYLRRGGFEEDARSALFDHLITGRRALGQGELERRCPFTLLHDAQACLDGLVRLRRQATDRRGGAVGNREHDQLLPTGSSDGDGPTRTWTGRIRPARFRNGTLPADA